VAIVLIGVSGSGKSTVGKQLARRLDCKFYEGDNYHSPANKKKMRAGIPLTDADRWPWLAKIRELISKVLAQEGCAVVACSALAQSYRDYLRQPGVQFVYLKGDFDLLRERLEKRRGHFFDPDLLASQFEALEEPRRALAVDVAHTPAAIAREIQERLGLNKLHEEQPAKDRDDDARPNLNDLKRSSSRALLQASAARGKTGIIQSRSVDQRKRTPMTRKSIKKSTVAQ
jgi:gluconokinase